MQHKYKNVIYAISFMDLFAIGLIFPLLGNHLKSLGASHFIVGVLASTYSGIQIVSGPLIGSWSDVGDRKIVLRISLFLCGICYLSLGFLGSVVAIFLVRVFLGIVKHTQGICRAMISDLFTPDEQTEMLSRSAALGTIGFIIGPVLGGYLSEMPNGFTYVCSFTFLLFIINIALTSFLPSFKSKHKEHSEDQPLHLNSVKQEFLKIGSNLKKVDWTKNWQIFALRFLFGVATTLSFYNEDIYMTEYFNLGRRNIGYVISLKGAIQTCTVLLIGHINKTFYKDDPDCHRRILHFSILMSLSSCLLCFASEFIFFMLCVLSFSISASILRMSTMELLLGKCKKEERGTFSGVSNSIMSVARFITPVMSGIVNDILGSHVSMLLPSIPAVVGMYLSLKILENIRKAEKQI